MVFPEFSRDCKGTTKNGFRKHFIRFFNNFVRLEFNTMDVDLLSKMVKELILDCDEVALPGVGTFVAELVPASFSDRGYTINPPYRRLFFRQRVDEDRLLADFYLRTNGLQADSPEGKVALQGLQEFLNEMKEMLKDKKTIVFPGLGRLRATRENNFFFIPDEDLDIYPAGYGLEPISLKTHEETPEEVSAAVAGLASIIDEPAPDSPAEAEPDESAEPITEAAGTDETVEPESSETAEEVAEAETITEEPSETGAAGTGEAEMTETAAVAAEAETVAEEKEVKKGRFWLWLLLSMGALLVLFLLALMILGRVAPDFVDKFLYSTDELRIIRY